jgi:serine/threonine-protein phosphatase 2A activator
MGPVDEARSEDRRNLETFPLLDLSKPHDFIKPAKKINEGQDVQRFLASRAYFDIGKFVMQLNISMCPRQLTVSGTKEIKTWELESLDIFSPGAVTQIQDLLTKINEITDEVPPDTGPRRFGNISFRKWYKLLESRVSDLLEEFLPEDILHIGSGGGVIAKDELTAYLLGGFGSAQRLDYGTGHELSFLAFLGCLWKLHAFEVANQTISEISRSIVLSIIEP